MAVDFIIKCEKFRKKLNLDEKFTKDYRNFKKATSLHFCCWLLLMLLCRLKSSSPVIGFLYKFHLVLTVSYSLLNLYSLLFLFNSQCLFYHFASQVSLNFPHILWVVFQKWSTIWFYCFSISLFKATVVAIMSVLHPNSLAHPSSFDPQVCTVLCDVKSSEVCSVKST